MMFHRHSVLSIWQKTKIFSPAGLTLFGSAETIFDQLRFSSDTNFKFISLASKYS
jgi:hypothetical protein